MKIYLISEATIKKYSLVGDNVDGKYILPTIEVCQNIDLDTLIGPVLKDKLCELVENNTISQAANSWYKQLLDDYVTPYMVWQVMAQLQISVNYKISNSGVYQNQDDKKVQQDYATNRALQHQYENYAASYALKMQDYLLKNVQYFPEYRKVKNYETSEDQNASGIFFPTNINRKRYIGK